MLCRAQSRVRCRASRSRPSGHAMIFGCGVEADLPDRIQCHVAAQVVAPGGVAQGRRDPDAAPSTCCRHARAARAAAGLTWPDRAWLALLAATLPIGRLGGMRLSVTPATILRWHRDIVCRRWARRSRRGRSGRPTVRRDVRSVVLRLARENESREYRRIHGELAGLGIAVAPSTVWQILKNAAISPAPRRDGPGLGRIPAVPGPPARGLSLPKTSFSGQAVRWYSWMTPPTRSRRRTRKASRSVTSAGSGLSGAALDKAI